MGTIVDLQRRLAAESAGRTNAEELLAATQAATEAMGRRIQALEQAAHEETEGKLQTTRGCIRLYL